MYASTADAAEGFPVSGAARPSAPLSHAPWANGTVGPPKEPSEQPATVLHATDWNTAAKCRSCRGAANHLAGHPPPPPPCACHALSAAPSLPHCLQTAQVKCETCQNTEVCTSCPAAQGHAMPCHSHMLQPRRLPLVLVERLLTSVLECSSHYWSYQAGKGCVLLATKFWAAEGESCMLAEGWECWPKEKNESEQKTAGGRGAPAGAQNRGVGWYKQQSRGKLEELAGKWGA